MRSSLMFHLEGWQPFFFFLAYFSFFSSLVLPGIVFFFLFFSLCFCWRFGSTTRTMLLSPFVLVSYESRRRGSGLGLLQNQNRLIARLNINIRRIQLMWIVPSCLFACIHI